VAIIFFAGLTLWSPALLPLRDNPVIFIAFVLFSVICAVSLLTDSVFVAASRADLVLIKNTIFCVLKIPLPFILVVTFRDFGIATSWGLATAASLLISLFFFVPRVYKHYRFRLLLNLSTVRNMLPYTIGSYVVSLLDSISTQVLPVIVINKAGSEQNAYFYITFMIANLLFAIPAAASRSLFAEASHFENELPVKINETLRFTFFLLIPGAIVIMVLAGFLLNLFGGNYADNGALLLRLFTLSSAFTGINTIYTSILRVKNRIKEMELLFLYKSVFLLVGSYLILPLFGITGIGYVWMLMHCFLSIYVFFAMRPLYLAKSKVTRQSVI
jgi:O-antigen/teichoic acid export membrane protein